MTTDTPKHLYKILSLDDWAKSQGRETLHLAIMDKSFIHMATKEQLEAIIKKYWSDFPQFMVLKLDSTKLTGKLILEANPGGKTQYYHLYDGAIPLSAVVESLTRNQ